MLPNMGFKTDWSHELGQVKQTVDEIVDEKLSPMVQDAIHTAGKELSAVVVQAGDQLQENIKTLSAEIHNQRRMTKEDVVELIDYASSKIGATIDERLSQAKSDISTLLTEKIAHVKAELEDAAIRSRRTLYVNIALSVTAAIAIAVIGIVYKKISIGELDVYALFRVLLISSAAGTGIYGMLKALNQWRSLNKSKKNAATIAINYLGIVRPNGAVGLFMITALLTAIWLLLTFYGEQLFATLGRYAN